jgi:hypothetical protein
MNSLTKFVVVAAALACLPLASLKFALAQNPPTAVKVPCVGCSPDGKTTPRMADGHPDFNGFWGGGATGGDHIAEAAADGSKLFDFGGNDVDDKGQTRSSKPGEESPGWTIGSAKPEDNPPYKPEYYAKVKAIAAETYGAANRNDPNLDCKPAGIPRGSFGQMHIVQTPQAIAVLFENAENTRIIYTDGRSHPSDLDTSYMGDSVGHWEGDTLVVDVAGLNDETWLAGSFGAPKFAILHSDQEHVIERWTRDGDVLNYEATVEDPVMFTKPWVIRPRRVRHNPGNDYLMQYHCITDDKGHIVVPTKTDPFLCNWGPQCVTTQNDTSHIDH